MRPANLRRFRRDQRGQTFVIVALMLTMLIGFTGLVTDIAWYEVNLMRIQRAADAAALAGVVYLPGNVPGAVTAARNESSKNGFTNGAGGVTVTAAPEPLNNKILGVVVTAPVRTFFARLFGVTQWTARRNARAEFILPVPMGSPEDYYGINVICRDLAVDVPPACPQVNSATGIGTLAPLGFFGSVEARGTERGNGDAYSTYYNGKPALNPGYDPGGFNYIVEFPAATLNGNVWLYDPMFCATGRRQNATLRRLGVGDFWFGSNAQPITSDYRLWDMNGTPYSTADDTQMAAVNYVSNGVDKSANYAGDRQYGGGVNSSNYGSKPDCAANPAHNNWVNLTQTIVGGLGEGQYRLQVVSSAGTLTEDSVNGFGIQVTSTAGPGGRIYGQSRMEAFIVINNTSVFYLAQVEAAHAGKILEIKLFDPGDIRDTIFRVRIPSAGAPGYQYASFTWTSTGTSGCAPAGSGSGGPVTQLRTSDAGGCNYYQNNWLTISAVIPATYTAPVACCPNDPGPGWWKIEYATAGTGQDITTWEVNIRGNPVHLITP